jgi:broad specificity phosphatase PhoE
LPVGIDKAAGEKMAPEVARTLDEYGVDSLVSSSLPRGEQSMKLIAKEMGGRVQTEANPKLDTWDTGDKVAGKPESQTIPLRQKYIKNSEIEMPGGESWDDFMNRFGTELNAIERRRAKGEEVAIIGHGHHLLATPALMEDRPVSPDELADLDERHPPGGVYGFFREGNTVRMERLDNGKEEMTNG